MNDKDVIKAIRKCGTPMTDSKFCSKKSERKSLCTLFN